MKSKAAIWLPVWPLGLAVACLACYLILSLAFSDGNGVVAAAGSVTQGSLQIFDNQGKLRTECPLKHTTVKAAISGGLSRVTVTQHFSNPLNEKIEAVYVFPLPANAAVDDMTMVIGERTVRGAIKRKEEARAIYDAAREAGKVASLLDQERPNIFTQWVANITPGAEVKVIISYVENLVYEDGSYEFVFPMVVGPRYIPGQPIQEPIEKLGGGWAPDTDRVPDASKITPPVAPKGERAGHDISLELVLDTGVPLESLLSLSHEIEISRPNAHSAALSLRDKATIPNKDFRLKFDVAGRKIADAILTHRASRGGFFSMILQPPDRVPSADVTPKELVFVLDTSGSMSGFPIEKAKETMKLALDGLNPLDTFNLITFSGDTHILFPEPVPATLENLRRAQAFLASRAGGGGTEMMKAIRAALDPSDKQNHIRVVCFMTDGYIGNDFEIIGEIQRHPNARVFSFGIGSSVNRFLLDKMSEVGRGEVEYVSLSDDGSAAAHRFHERVRNPLLTDINLDWGGLAVTDVFPKRVPDLFGAKPVVISGRYSSPGRGVLRLRGKFGGSYIAREIPIEFPESQSGNDVLATLWARARVDDLMSCDYASLQRGETSSETREAIVQLGIDYRLMTQFTSFVAVEEMIITDGGKPRRIQVPVEMPEGVSHEGVFGKGEAGHRMKQSGQASNAVSVQSMPVAELSTPSNRPLNGRPVFSPSSAPQPTPLPNSGLLDPANESSRKDGLSRFHPSILAVIERLQKKQSQPTAAESSFVRQGKAEIQIWLLEKTPAYMAELKRLGFEVIVETANSKLVIGKLPIEKLGLLKELKFVRFVAPQS